MSKIKFYLRASRNYYAITADDALNIGEIVEYLQHNENVYISNDFWNVQDDNGKTAMDFLCGEDQGGRDMADYLLDVFSKIVQCDKSYLETLESSYRGYAVISSADIDEELRDVCVYNVTESRLEKKILVNDVVKVKRYYLNLSTSYEEYKLRVRDCFTELIFHEDAFKSVNKLGKIHEIRKELTRHLSALNDVAGVAYTYYNGKESDVFKELDAGGGIVCSGKGANESRDFKKKITWEETEYTLTCNPHTKLFRKNTDQRIYFCWGRKEIKGHKIIIVRIGDHWR